MLYIPSKRRKVPHCMPLLKFFLYLRTIFVTLSCVSMDDKLLFCPSLFSVNPHRSLESSLGAFPSLFPVNPHRSSLQSQTLEKRREQRVRMEASGGVKRWCRASPSRRGRAPRVEGRVAWGSRGTLRGLSGLGIQNEVNVIIFECKLDYVIKLTMNVMINLDLI
jgi:hypothetical protein